MILTLAKALPEKTFVLTTKPASVVGYAIAPEACPAFKAAATLGAIAFPVWSCEKITTSAPVSATAAATNFVPCWSFATFNPLCTKTFLAPYSPNTEESLKIAFSLCGWICDTS